MRRMHLMNCFATAMLAGAASGGIACDPVPNRATLATHLGPSIVKLETLGGGQGCTSHGTGFIVSSSGHVLTAGHVVPVECLDQQIYGRRAADSLPFTLNVVERSGLDVALLQIVGPETAYPSLTLVRPMSDSIDYEGRAVVIGSFYRGYSRPTVTNARIDSVEVIGDPHKWGLCATAANPDRSGSPVALEDGTVVAVFIERPSQGEQDIASVIPIAQVLDIVAFTREPPLVASVPSPRQPGPQHAESLASAPPVLEISARESPDLAGFSAGVVATATSAPVSGGLPPSDGDRLMWRDVDRRALATGRPSSASGGQLLSREIGRGANAIIRRRAPAAAIEPANVFYEFNISDTAYARLSPFINRNRFLLSSGGMAPATHMSSIQVVRRIAEGARLRYAETYERVFDAPPGFRFDPSFFDLRVASHNPPEAPLPVTRCSARVRVDCYEFSRDGSRLSVRYRLFAGPLGDAARGWLRGSVVTNLVETSG